MNSTLKEGWGKINNLVFYQADVGDYLYNRFEIGVYPRLQIRENQLNNLIICNHFFIVPIGPLLMLCVWCYQFDAQNIYSFLDEIFTETQIRLDCPRLHPNYE